MRLVFQNTSALSCAVGLFQNKEYNQVTEKDKKEHQKNVFSLVFQKKHLL